MAGGVIKGVVAAVDKVEELMTRPRFSISTSTQFILASVAGQYSKN